MHHHRVGRYSYIVEPRFEARLERAHVRRAVRVCDARAQPADFRVREAFENFRVYRDFHFFKSFLISRRFRAAREPADGPARRAAGGEERQYVEADARVSDYERDDGDLPYVEGPRARDADPRQRERAAPALIRKRHDGGRGEAPSEAAEEREDVSRREPRERDTQQRDGEGLARAHEDERREREYVRRAELDSWRGHRKRALGEIYGERAGGQQSGED